MEWERDPLPSWFWTSKVNLKFEFAIKLGAVHKGCHAQNCEKSTPPPCPQNVGTDSTPVFLVRADTP